MDASVLSNTIARVFEIFQIFSAHLRRERGGESGTIRAAFR